MKIAISLREAKSETAICRLPRDNYSVGDWSIMTSGYTVWISKQKIGENRTDHIEIPKRVFDALVDRYMRPQQIKKR